MNEPIALHCFIPHELAEVNLILFISQFMAIYESKSLSKFILWINFFIRHSRAGAINGLKVRTFQPVVVSLCPSEKMIECQPAPGPWA